MTKTELYRQLIDADKLVADLKTNGVSELWVCIDSIDYFVKSPLKVIKDQNGDQYILASGEGGYSTNNAHTYDVRDIHIYVQLKDLQECDEAVVELADRIFKATGYVVTICEDEK